MSGVVAWGDVPQWLEASGVWAAVLFQGVQRARREWAEDWPKLVESLSDLTPGDIHRVMEANPVIAEMVGVAWETAAQTATEEKRWLLARVVVEAMKGPDDAEVDKLPFLLRTVVALEPAHMRLLVFIGTPRPGKGQMVHTRLEGYSTPDELRTLWPQAADLVEPMTALLLREGLIENRAAGSWDGGPAWGLTGYGRQLLRFLPEDADWARRLDTAEIVVRLEGNLELVVRNLGPGWAQSVELVLPRRSDGNSIIARPTSPSGLPAEEVETATFDIRAEEEKVFHLFPATVGDRPPYDITVKWRDVRGHRSRRQPDVRPEA